MAGRNDAALAMKQAETPLVARSTPPTAGPSTRDTFWTTSYKPTALAARSVPTRSST